VFLFRLLQERKITTLKRTKKNGKKDKTTKRKVTWMTRKEGPTKEISSLFDDDLHLLAIHAALHHCAGDAQRTMLHR